jgi:Asp-tRNA(Asn)/Glu-tRNA(Gln) amidotransferase A subunit family amidase
MAPVNTRRQFLITAPMGFVTAAGACRRQPPAESSASASAQDTPGAPVAFGTATPTGPEVTAATFAAAERLAQVSYTDADRAMMAASWRRSMPPLVERRTGPRRVALPETLAPAMTWNPVLPEMQVPAPRNRFVASGAAPPLPSSDDEIAFAPVTALSRWIAARQLTSERLTAIYLDRIARHDGGLRSVITLLRDEALRDARAADTEIAAGRYRGPLHGIPYGAKDLIDTAGVATTYGAEPFRDRVPSSDAVLIARLRAAGAVLLAKLSLGALALNDIWFGGQTMNPWLPEEGASGSSAGPGAALAAGLVGFAIGSETQGSIVAPTMRCGVTGLRPTFGRVARTGSLPLCWSLDKLGPMARGVEDTMLVLAAINGADRGDPSSVDRPIEYDAAQPVAGLRVGYIESWMTSAPATEVDRAALKLASDAGMRPVPVRWPDLPHASLMPILFCESAASFEELDRSGASRQLKVQVPDAWPNFIRMSRFVSAVDYVQADRLRRIFAQELAAIFDQVDLLLVPGLRDESLTVSNYTGHPSLTLRTGFVEVKEARSDWAPDPANPLPTFDPPRRVPHGVSLIGRLFDEGTVIRAGLAIERAAGVASARPAGF